MAQLKTFSFPIADDELFEWLKQQPNQSEAVREGLKLLREEGSEMGKIRSLLLEIRHELKLLREKADE